jgi:hypothetical protein
MRQDEQQGEEEEEEEGEEEEEEEEKEEGRQKQEASSFQRPVPSIRARFNTEKWFKRWRLEGIAIFSLGKVWTAKPKSQYNLNPKSVSVTAGGFERYPKASGHRRWNRFVSSYCVSNRL